MSASSVAVKTFVIEPISNSVRSSGGPPPGRTSPRKRTSVRSPSRTAQTSAWWRRPACAARTSSIGATAASYGRARRKPPEWGQESASRSGTFGRVPDTSSIVRRALGGEIDRALRPVLLVTLLHAISGSARVSFLGIWAIRELDASSLALGVTFTCAAIASVFTGYLGGHAVRPHRPTPAHPGCVGRTGGRGHPAGRERRRVPHGPRTGGARRRGRGAGDRVRPGHPHGSRAAGASGAGVRRCARRPEPRLRGRAAGRRAPAARRLERAVRRHGGSRRDRVRRRAALPAAARHVRAGEAARPRLVEACSPATAASPCSSSRAASRRSSTCRTRRSCRSRRRTPTASARARGAPCW